MTRGEPGPGPSGSIDRAAATAGPARPGNGRSAPAVVIEATISPFHCLYQDALFFHNQGHLRLSQSESEAGRLSRAALVLYLNAAEALVHQAAVELGRAELATVVADARRPIPLDEAWRLLPAIVGGGRGLAGDLSAPPWPQFAELLELRAGWSYPGAADSRRAYYASDRPDGQFEPLQPHQAPAGLGIPADRLAFPRTGLPRDPYALRPRHLDTARGVLDAAIDALDHRLDGALTRDARHRREPVRMLGPA